MNTSNLFAKFARIGARLKVADRPSRRFWNKSGIISLDVQEDREGEYFEVAPRSQADLDMPSSTFSPSTGTFCLWSVVEARSGSFCAVMTSGTGSSPLFPSPLLSVPSARQSRHSNPPRSGSPKAGAGSARRHGTVARMRRSAVRANGFSCRCPVPRRRTLGSAK